MHACDIKRLLFNKNHKKIRHSVKKTLKHWAAINFTIGQAIERGTVHVLLTKAEKQHEILFFQDVEVMHWFNYALVEPKICSWTF